MLPDEKHITALCGVKINPAGGAGGAGGLRQDFSIKPAVKNEWLWQLDAFCVRQPAVLTVHFDSLSTLLLRACVPRRLHPPPPSPCTFTQGLLHMLDTMRKKRNKGKHLVDKVGHAVRTGGEQRPQIQPNGLCTNSSTNLKHTSQYVTSREITRHCDAYRRTRQQKNQKI